jgi:2-phosphoglycerate kinase
MNPEKSGFDRTYFIAGAPRIGKTTLAHRLSKEIQGHVVSTDAIRAAAKKVCEDKSGPLFKINHYNALDPAEWLDRHLHRPEEVVEDQNKESNAVWQSIVSFCNSFYEDDSNHIVEGVHLLPSLVAAMENQPNKVVYIGNTTDEHVESILEYSRNNTDRCWLTVYGYTEEKMRGIANVVKQQSLYFKTEAEKYNLPYFEISDDDYASDMDKVINYLTS